jgi:hypothetical protein
MQESIVSKFTITEAKVFLFAQAVPSETGRQMKPVGSGQQQADSAL